MDHRPQVVGLLHLLPRPGTSWPRLQPLACAPRAVLVGDLLEVEEGSGVWVVVDESPEEDLAEPGCLAISWRGDGDESGSMSVPEDELLRVRRPEEEW